MATKYFSDFAGSTVELPNQYGLKNAEFAAKFPGIKGKRYDSFMMLVGKTPEGLVLPITRQIVFKSNPSKHECDARCMHATGKVMKCECACGGKNHGRGN